MSTRLFFFRIIMVYNFLNMTDQPKDHRILSIEDDEFITLFLTDVMWIFGTADNIKLTSVSSTEKAMVAIKDQTNRPDLILLDLALPNKDGDKADPENGFKFLELLKTDPSLMDIKVLVFSGSSDPKYQERAVRLGAGKFLVKGDYLPKELIDVIKNALGITSSAVPIPQTPQPPETTSGSMKPIEPIKPSQVIELPTIPPDQT